jgi:hypothetical protein
VERPLGSARETSFPREGGLSGRAMLDALIGGTTDPMVLAELG